MGSDAMRGTILTVGLNGGSKDPPYGVSDAR